MADNEEFKKITKAIDTDIDAAAKTAKESGKPLLILVGEEHVSPKAAVLDAAIIKSANDAGIKQYADEADAMMLAMSELKELKERSTTLDFNAPLAKKALGMKVTGIEKPDETVESGLTVEGIKRREAYMTKELLEFKESTVFTTGKNHLEAFATNPEILKKYHVLVINTSDSESKDKPVTELDKLSAVRNAYANDPKNAKQYRLDDNILKDSGMPALLKQVLGEEKFAVFDQALKQPPPPKFNPQPLELKPLQEKKFSDKELSAAAEMSPKLVEDTKAGRNFAPALAGANILSLERLAEASKKQQEITELIRTRAAYDAFAVKALPIDRVEKLNADQIKTLEKMGLDCATPQQFAEKLAKLDGGTVPKLAPPPAPPVRSDLGL